MIYAPGVLYPHGWRYRQAFLSTRWPIILVFWPPAPVPNFKKNLVSGGAKYTGVGKYCDFRMKSQFISDMVRHRPMVAAKR